MVTFAEQVQQMKKTLLLSSPGASQPTHIKATVWLLRRLIWAVFLYVHLLFHVATITLPWIGFHLWFVFPYNAVMSVLSLPKYFTTATSTTAPVATAEEEEVLSKSGSPHHTHAKHHPKMHPPTMKDRVSKLVSHSMTHHKRLLHGHGVVFTSRTCDPTHVFTIAKDAARAMKLFGIVVDPTHVTKQKKNDLQAPAPSPIDMLDAPRAQDTTKRPTVYEAPLYNQHIGTILGAFRPFHAVQYQRDHFKAHDGCTLVADWSLMCSNSGQVIRGGKAKGVLVIHPGLASSSSSSYIQTFVRHATNADVQAGRTGFHCCVLNTRGMGDTPLDEPKLMSASFTHDLRTAYHKYFTKDKIEQFCGEALPVLAVGFSLGANVLVKFLGEEGASLRKGGSGAGSEAFSVLRGAAAICGPWDMHDTQMNMSKLSSRILYQPSMKNGLMEYVYRHADMCSSFKEVDFNSILASPKGKGVFKSVQEFDQAVIVPHFGYDNVHQYYSDSMCFPHIHNTPVPLLCFAAIDDPITGKPPSDGKWMSECNKNENVVYVATRVGGHIGFLGSPLDEMLHKPNFMEQFVVDSLGHLSTSL